MEITKELFHEMISGFESSPMWFKTKDGWSSELYYEKMIGDFVRTLSSGKPRLFKFDEILEIGFEPPVSAAKQQEIAIEHESLFQAADKTDPAFMYGKENALDIMKQVKRHIWLHSFSLEDRYNAIHEAVRHTPLEKEWIRTQNMLKEAKKNNAVSEKAKSIVTILEKLPEGYDCIELYQMLGEAYACCKNFSDASLQYEIAGDYQNAAYYAAKCGDDGLRYQMEVFRKWILTDRNYTKEVLASFFSVTHTLHCGRLCAETIGQIDISQQDGSVKAILYYGLIFALTNYLDDVQIPINAEISSEQISKLLELLFSETNSEDYEPEKIQKLKHASEIIIGDSTYGDTWDENIHIGYIINPHDSFGFIGKEADSRVGIYFRPSNLSAEISSLYVKHYLSLKGLKVAYKCIAARHQGEEKDTAAEIQPAENLEEFLKRNGNVQTPTDADNTSAAEEKLMQNTDGKTFCGYIIRFKGSFGFIHKDIHAAEGVFFHVSDLESQLKDISDKLVGLKVNCTLKDSSTKNNEKQAAKITAAESIEAFLKRKSAQSPSASDASDAEVVDEKAVSDALKCKLPSAVVQEFATTNRPLHALEALEKSKDSFSYDKYVKHKIQLLQRTKSSDNELIQLLNYAITTSHEGSYIAHNLYFLGQVQYRCKQYSDVIGTMKQLQKYKTFMKSRTQYTDALYLMAVAYYMLRDYTNSDLYAKELQNLNAHTEEISRLLNRTFVSETDLSGNVHDMESESTLQFDTEAALTPFIENLIDGFSFGSISLRDIPADFDPQDCPIDICKKYIESLIKYDKKPEQKNNPNAAIAISKIQKCIIEKSSDEEKEKTEKSLRNNVSRALQIIARNTLQESGMDIRVNLFYRMQQYKMSVCEQKPELFNAYINAHYVNAHNGTKDMKSMRISANLRDTDYQLMISDVLLFCSYVNTNITDEEKERIRKLCNILTSQNDAKEYRQALYNILRILQASFNENSSLSALVECGSKAMGTWLNNYRTDIRGKAESRQWDELQAALRVLAECELLTPHEKTFVEQVLDVIGHLDSAERNTQTAMKQNSLNQSKNKLDELSEDLEDKPTYILYSFFADVLAIFKNSTLTMLAELMSHAPNIEPVGSLRINVGLTDSGEFLLPLEFQNHAPAVQAKNLTIQIENMTAGVSRQSSLPIGQNVDEGEKYSQSLTFRLESLKVEQVDISIKLEYSHDTFDNLKQAYERQNEVKTVKYTISFQKVPKIQNRYREYAKQQTVKDKSMFFGRDQIIQKLYEAVSVCNDNGSYILRGGNGIVLYGQRRSGKTSILYHLKEKIIRDMDHTIVVDLGSSGKAISCNSDHMQMDEKELQNRNANMTLETLYHLILSGIRAYIEDNRYDNAAIADLYDKIQKYKQETSESIYPDTSAFLEATNCQLLFNDFMEKFSNIARSEDPQNGFRILILIDEFTYFNTAIQQHRLPNNFMEIWKGIVSDSFITLIVAGQDNMVEFIEDYVNEFSSFHREWVTFLGKDASYKMVTDPIGAERIDSDAADKLYHITAGSPFLLMDICAELVDWMNDNKILKLSGSLPDDFFVGKYMKEFGFKQDLFEPQYKDAGRLEWTNDIKLVLGLIARSTSKKVSPNLIHWNEFDQYAAIEDKALEGRGIHAGRMREILERLVKRQVLEAQEGYQNKYRIKIPLYREWILRRGGAEYGNE